MKNEPSPHVPVSAPRKMLSTWEWLPLGLVLALAVIFHITVPGSALNRFAFWVGLGFIPGALWRLLGRSAWNVHRICFALALVAFVLENPALRPDVGALAKIGEHWELVALGVVVSFSQPFWGAIRIHRLLIDSGIDIKPLETLKLCFVGSFFNIFLPGATGGDAYRIYAIAKGYRARLGPAIASVTLDRFLGLPSLILVVLLGMALDCHFLLSNRILSKLTPFIFGSGVVCLLLLVYLALAGRTHRRNSESGFLNVKDEAAGWGRRLHTILATNVKRSSTLPLTLLYGFLSHVACILACLFFGIALGVEGVSELRYFLIVPMAMAINAIPGAPGGVGQGELAMATLLDMAHPGGINAQAGVVLMLLLRLSNLLIGVVGGVIYAMGKGAARAEDGNTAWR